MAQSQVNLYNLALAAAGMKYTLSAVSDQTVPAKTCELYYENTRQTVLRAAHWKSAKRHARLVQETERDLAADWVTSDPEPGYAFSYALPSGLLAARYLSDYSEFDIGYDDDKKILSTNCGGSATTDAPVLSFTTDVTDVTIWEPDLYQAMYYALAGNVCMALTGKLQRTREVFNLANGFILEARANTANEMHRRMEQVPRRLQARGYQYGVTAPFLYPYGSLLSATGAPLV